MSRNWWLHRTVSAANNRSPSKLFELRAAGHPVDRLPRRPLIRLDLLSLRLDVAKPRIDHRRIDEIDLAAAAARDALAGAQPVDGAEQVAHRIARFGFGAERAQRHAQSTPGLAERGPGQGVVRMQGDPGLQI